LIDNCTGTARKIQAVTFFLAFHVEVWDLYFLHIDSKVIQHFSVTFSSKKQIWQLGKGILQA
jgi:hypothetical protein